MTAILMDFGLAQIISSVFPENARGNFFTLGLDRVDALALTEIKYGNIVFDLVLRSGPQLTTSDIEELFCVKPDTPQATDMLKVKSEAGFQLLEINSSYGAHGLVLFSSSMATARSPTKSQPQSRGAAVR